MNTYTRFFTRILAFTLFFLLLFPMAASAAECQHKFDNDICKKCGYIRLHEFDFEISFFTIKDCVPIWDSPTKNSTKLREIDSKDTQIRLEAILRNQYGNIWFKLADEDAYVYIGNVYLDFITLCMLNYQQIIAWDDFETCFTVFLDLVQPGGSADYKNWLDPSSKGISYSVKINDSYYDMTAEELGNIHYGFLGRAMGFDSDLLLYAGGFVNMYGDYATLFTTDFQEAVDFCSVFGHTSFAAVCTTAAFSVKTLDTVGQTLWECTLSYCDERNDVVDIKAGIHFYDTGEFSW